MKHDSNLEANFTPSAISVIIPCYNQAHFLDDAIQSVLAQNYPNSEIILVDDGSTDATSEHAARYPTVRYIYQENQGLSAARNTGTHASQGEFLVYLDSDDRLLPGALQTNIEYMLANSEFGFVAGHYYYITTDGSFQHENPRHGVVNDYYSNLLRDNFIGMHVAVMYRRTVIEAVGDFDPALRGCEDYDIYLRISKEYPIHCHGKVLAEYRRHGQGISNNPSLMLRSVQTIFDRELAYVEQHQDAQLQEAFRRGINTWRNRYGRELLLKAIKLAQRAQLAEACSQLTMLLPYVPGSLFWRASQILPVLSPLAKVFSRRLGV